MWLQRKRDDQMSFPEPIERIDPETAALLQKLYTSFTIDRNGYADQRCWPVYRFITVSPDRAAL